MLSSAEQRLKGDQDNCGMGRPTVSVVISTFTLTLFYVIDGAQLGLSSTFITFMECLSNKRMRSQIIHSEDTNFYQALSTKRDQMVILVVLNRKTLLYFGVCIVHIRSNHEAYNN